jgi:hypothetical protein
MVWALCLTAASIVTIRAANDKGVTAAQINGTWATPAGEFKIWALDHHRLRVEFSVAAEHKGEPGPMANAGDGHGIATIQGDSAIFKPNGADADCRITLKFNCRLTGATSANTPMSTARTQKFRRANQSFVLRRSFILLYQTMSVYFDAS